MSIRMDKRIFRFLVSLIGLVIISGCSGGGSSSSPPPPQLCQTNSTATVSFSNKSNTNSTYDIIWDGSKITTVSPGNTSSSFTVAAGVQHTLEFKKTNTNTQACTPSSPTLAVCESAVFSCTG